MEIFQLHDITIKLVATPENTLSWQEKKKLLFEAIPLTRRAFCNEYVSEIDIIKHVMEVSMLIYLEDRHGNLLGFSSCIWDTIENRTILHLKGTVLLPTHQGKGLYNLLTAVRILSEAEKHNTASLFVSTRTQSPKVFQVMSRNLDLHPKIDEATTKNLMSVAYTYATHIWQREGSFLPEEQPQFEENFVVKQAYYYLDKVGKKRGFCLYGNNIPWSTEERVNAFIRKNLDLSNGDAIFLIGTYSKQRAINMLHHAVYKGSDQVQLLVDRFC